VKAVSPSLLYNRLHGLSVAIRWTSGSPTAARASRPSGTSALDRFLVACAQGCHFRLKPLSVPTRPSPKPFGSAEAARASLPCVCTCGGLLDISEEELRSWGYRVEEHQIARYRHEPQLPRDGAAAHRAQVRRAARSHTQEFEQQQYAASGIKSPAGMHRV
jgi:hypothetical protein